MGRFRRVLYDVLIEITFWSVFPLVACLVWLMPNVFMNVFMDLAISFALASLYTAIISLLQYLRERSEHENQR